MRLYSVAEKVRRSRKWRKFQSLARGDARTRERELEFERVLGLSFDTNFLPKSNQENFLMIAVHDRKNLIFVNVNKMERLLKFRVLSPSDGLISSISLSPESGALTEVGF